jgi:hypothetical protein
MAFKQKIYIAGPRMGQNNTMYGVELKDINKSKPRKRKSNGSKKRS